MDRSQTPLRVLKMLTPIGDLGIAREPLVTVNPSSEVDIVGKSIRALFCENRVMIFKFAVLFRV